MRREAAKDAGRARGGPRRRRAAALPAELEAGGAIPVLVEGTQRRTTLKMGRMPSSEEEQFRFFLRF